MHPINHIVNSQAFPQPETAMLCINRTEEVAAKHLPASSHPMLSRFALRTGPSAKQKPQEASPMNIDSSALRRPQRERTPSERLLKSFELEDFKHKYKRHREDQPSNHDLNPSDQRGRKKTKLDLTGSAEVPVPMETDAPPAPVLKKKWIGWSTTIREWGLKYVMENSISSAKKKRFQNDWEIVWETLKKKSKPNPIFDEYLRKTPEEMAQHADELTRVGISDIPGVGRQVIANKNLPKGTVIGRYVGYVTDRPGVRPTYTFVYNGKMNHWAIEAHEICSHTAFCNDNGVKSNLDIVEYYTKNGPEIILFTNHAVKEGEELTWHYGKEYWAHIGIEHVPLLASKSDSSIGNRRSFRDETPGKPYFIRTKS